ncbi:hypothetical protein LMG7974_01435 [Campylobacter majalis]|uniref:Pentapeptide repeat-containing protein n=1 Tax=Campylobacter majalis TaxID=2790656 RepID=A0ABM8Q8W5_9BACT|nr:pentapeptide repeat-containing protein [Campylobacter majalis]CAD7289274.1 hypothetical protein LMG7974_01435 [Campylobacter majalis]
MELNLNKSDNFVQNHKKLQEIFGDNKVKFRNEIGVDYTKRVHIVQDVDQINMVKNEQLQDILQQDIIEFHECKNLGYVLINDFKNIAFKNCKIEIFESRKSDTEIKENLTFLDCEFYSMNENIVLNSTNFKNIIFKDCIFNSSIKISGSKFENFIFENCDVNGKFIANDCIFENANFKDSHFYDIVNLKNSIFKNNVYFNNSIFNKFADFHECEFKNTASFYGVTFCQTPNFSSVSFDKKAILINMAFNSKTFDDIKRDCDEEAKNRLNDDKHTNKPEQEIYTKVYSDFRSSFALLKHTLNSSGNLIDASNHHKAELYCKEMELECSLGIKKYTAKQQNKQDMYIQRTDKQDINIIRFFKFIKFIILVLILILIWSIKSMFNIFRNTAKFILYLLLFTIFTILLYLFSTKKCAWKRKILISINKLKINNFTLWFDYMVLYLYRNTSNHHTNLNKIFNFTILMIATYGLNLLCTYNFNSFVIQQGMEAIYTILSIILIGCLAILVASNKKKIHLLSIRAIVFLSLVFTMITLPLQHISYVTFGILMYGLFTFLAFYLFMQKSKIAIIITKTVSYVILVSVLLIHPELINPTLNIFNKENMQNQLLLEEINKANYEILSNLTRLSFRDCDLKSETKFDEGSIINQREIIIANKETLENMFDLLFAPKSIDNFTGNKDDFIKTKTIVENQDIYLKIYNAIKLDKINSQTYKSTYILYILVMILCLYSLTKTARKNSVM